MIRLFALTSLVLISLTLLRAEALAAGYFSAIEDLPLPPSLVENVDDSVVFDSPQGRIVTVMARGRATVGAVKSYYIKALPPLGWRPGADGRFLRDNETLTFDYSVVAGTLTVRIKLLPAPAR